MASPGSINSGNTDSTNKAITASKKKESSNENFIVFPHGRCGWFALAASLLCLLISDGILFSFGVMVLDRNEVFYKTISIRKVMFLSCANGSSFCSGYVVSKLSKRFGFYIVMIAKTTFSFMGLLIYYISQTLDSLFILQVLGMVFGVVDVLVTTPIVVEGGSAERRTLVTGIALCYSGAGALLFGPVIYFLNEKFPTAESFYYLTCFYLVCALFGWLYGLCCNLQHKKLQEDRPSKKVKWASRRTDQEQPGNGNQTLEDEYVAIPMADRPPDSNGIEEALQNQVQTEEQPATNDKSNSENMERENGIESIVKKSMLKRFTNYLRGIFLRFKSATFVAISIASFLQAFGLFVPIVHLPAHAISVGISKVEAVFLVSAIGLSSTIGRIFNGWLSDQPKVAVLFWNNVGLSITGIVITFLPLFTSCRWLVVFSVIFGLASSCTIVSHPIVLGKPLKSKDVTNSYGFIHMCYRAGVFTGVFVAGLLFDFFDHYRFSFYVVGFFVRLSAILCWYLPRINGWERRRSD